MGASSFQGPDHLLLGSRYQSLQSTEGCSDRWRIVGAWMLSTTQHPTVYRYVVSSFLSFHWALVMEDKGNRPSMRWRAEPSGLCLRRWQPSMSHRRRDWTNYHLWRRRSNSAPHLYHRASVPLLLYRSSRIEWSSGGRGYDCSRSVGLGGRLGEPQAGSGL